MSMKNDLFYKPDILSNPRVILTGVRTAICLDYENEMKKIYKNNELVLIM